MRNAIKSDPLLPLAQSGSDTWSVPVALRNRLIGLNAANQETTGTIAQNTMGWLQCPAELATLLRPPQAPDEIGRLPGYRILKVLGKGGMGIVCLAEDEQLRRRVAIKLILPGLAADPRVLAMFLREARSLAATPHDHVVTVFQVGQDDKTLFLVMEFLEGETVAHWMMDNPTRSLGEVLRIAREAIAGLASIHARGIVHRDFKPANTWRTAGSGRVKLLDFGLARQYENDGLTAPGQVLGTATYMAPEQAMGAQVDARADLFSFGVSLYELCSGRSPFARHSQLNSLVAVTDHHPEPLSRIHPWLPAELVALTSDLLAKDPTTRVQTASEVLARLQRIEADAAGMQGALVGTPPRVVEVVPLAEPVDTANAMDFAASTEVSPKRAAAVGVRGPGRWVWVGLAAGVLALAGIGFALMNGGQKKDPPTNVVPPTDAKGPNGKPYPPLITDPKAPPPPQAGNPPGGRIAEVVTGGAGLVLCHVHPDAPDVQLKPGDPMSFLSLTRKPTIYPGILSWTLETVRQRKPVTTFAFQPGGSLFAAGSADGTIRIYDTKTWQLVKAIVTPTYLGNFTWTRDGKQLIVQSTNDQHGKLLAWELETGKILREFSGVGKLDSLTVSPDGKFLAGTTGHTVWVSSLSPGVHPVKLELPNTAATSVSWHPESKLLMVGYNIGEIRIWDVAEKKVVRNIKSGFDSLHRVEWSPDGKKWAATRINATEVAVWFGEKRIELGQCESFTWSPTGDDLMTGSRSWMRVFDTRNENGKFKEFKDIRAGQLGVSSDEKLIALTNFGEKTGQIVDRAGKTVHNLTEDASAFSADEGFFREPKDGKPAFVFVIQTHKGQETLTPAEFAKRTGWKNQPEKVFSP